MARCFVRPAMNQVVRHLMQLFRQTLRSPDSSDNFFVTYLYTAHPPSWDSMKVRWVGDRGFQFELYEDTDLRCSINVLVNGVDPACYGFFLTHCQLSAVYHAQGPPLFSVQSVQMSVINAMPEQLSLLNIEDARRELLQYLLQQSQHGDDTPGEASDDNEEFKSHIARLVQLQTELAMEVENEAAAETTEQTYERCTLQRRRPNKRKLSGDQDERSLPAERVAYTARGDVEIMDISQVATPVAHMLKRELCRCAETFFNLRLPTTYVPQWDNLQLSQVTDNFFTFALYEQGELRCLVELMVNGHAPTRGDDHHTMVFCNLSVRYWPPCGHARLFNHLQSVNMCTKIENREIMRPCTQPGQQLLAEGHVEHQVLSSSEHPQACKDQLAQSEQLQVQTREQHVGQQPAACWQEHDVGKARRPVQVVRPTIRRRPNVSVQRENAPLALRENTTLAQHGNTPLAQHGNTPLAQREITPLAQREITPLSRRGNASSAQQEYVPFAQQENVRPEQEYYEEQQHARSGQQQSRCFASHTAGGNTWSAQGLVQRSLPRPQERKMLAVKPRMVREQVQRVRPLQHTQANDLAP